MIKLVECGGRQGVWVRDQLRADFTSRQGIIKGARGEGGGETKGSEGVGEDNQLDRRGLVGDWGGGGVKEGGGGGG